MNSNQHVIETRVFYTWLDNEGFCRTEVKPMAEINVDDARENTVAVKTVSKGQIYPIIVDLKQIKSISKEARDHFAMGNREPGVSAIAMVIKSPLSVVIANFFLGLNKPSVPTRMFSTCEAAIQWAAQFQKL